MVNSVNPDVTARYEPPYLDLHCLHMYLFWSARLKGFNKPMYKKLRHLGVVHLVHNNKIRNKNDIASFEQLLSCVYSVGTNSTFLLLGGYSNFRIQETILLNTLV